MCVCVSPVAAGAGRYWIWGAGDWPGLVEGASEPLSLAGVRGGTSLLGSVASARLSRRGVWGFCQRGYKGGGIRIRSARWREASRLTHGGVYEVRGSFTNVSVSIVRRFAVSNPVPNCTTRNTQANSFLFRDQYHRPPAGHLPSPFAHRPLHPIPPAAVAMPPCPMWHRQRGRAPAIPINLGKSKEQTTIEQQQEFLTRNSAHRSPLGGNPGADAP